ncbi:MAG: hypothetical protein OXT65_06575 [Alphaproteobacteria bacterium]|nr:hypothetical protein [Alphaproteobacteria bacterium]
MKAGIEEGVDVARDGDRYTQEKRLVRAAVRGDSTEIMRLYRRSGSVRLNVHYNNEEALRAAVVNNHADTVSTLMYCGADLFAVQGFLRDMDRGGKGNAAVQRMRKHMAAQKHDFEDGLSRLQLLAKPKLVYPARHMSDEPGLVRALRMGCLDTVAETLQRTGESLIYSDLTQIKNRDGVTVAEMARQEGMLERLLSDDFWQGNKKEQEKARARLLVANDAGMGERATVFKKKLKDGIRKFKLD